MQNRSKLKAIGLLAMLALGAGGAVAAPGVDEAALRAQTTSWIKAFNNGDAKAMTAQYADDALLLPPGAPGAKGKTAIMAYFVKELAGAKTAGVVFATDPQTDVGVSGNMGWESGTYKVLIKGAVVETGKFLSVSEKKEGKWHYIRDTWNADAPPPAAAPAAKK
jgi:ketosteroid isomerase-like protein